MTAAKLQVGQNQFLVEVEPVNAAPIEVPMAMGFSYWQGPKNENRIKVKGGNLPYLLGGPYALHIENKIFNFKPWHFLGNNCWEGILTCKDA